MAATRTPPGMSSAGEVTIHSSFTCSMAGPISPIRKAAIADQREGVHEVAHARRHQVHEHRQAQVLVAVHREDGAEHRHPDERERDGFVDPADRAARTRSARPRRRTASATMATISAAETASSGAIHRVRARLDRRLVGRRGFEVVVGDRRGGAGVRHGSLHGMAGGALRRPDQAAPDRTRRAPGRAISAGGVREHRPAVRPACRCTSRAAPRPRGRTSSASRRSSRTSAAPRGRACRRPC